MKKAPVLLSFILVFTFLACSKKASEKRELTDYITENTTSVWRIDDWSNYNALIQSQYATNATEKSSEVSKLLAHLHPSKTGLITAISTDSTYYYTLITPQDSLLLPTDTTQYNIHKEQNITKYTSKDYSFYAGIRDSIVLVGTNETLLKEMLSDNKQKNDKLKQLLSVKSKSEIVGLRKNTEQTGIAEWSVLDFSQTESGFLATGVLQSTDSLGYWTNLIYGQKPQPIRLAAYTPNQATSAWALVYQDAELLQKQLQIYTGKTITPKELEILEASDEVSCITLPSGSAFGINSLDSETLMQLLVTDVKNDEVYREIPIYAVENEQLMENIKSAFCSDTALNWLVVLDEYFIFTEDKTLAKEFITTQINKHNLAETEAFKETAKTLSSNASLLYYSMDGELPKDLQKETALEIFGSKSSVNKSQFPLLVLQLNADKGFSHINFLAHQGSGQNLNSTRVAENLQIKIEYGILKGPIYFSNHLTHRKDILVQDQANTLHLYNSENGKKYWSKPLDSPILGEIHEVDLYKNGRKQLAFATESRLHILARDGSEVAPFPIKFKDKVTQGLAVFDYSNNSDYRFVILQGNEVLMYNKNANTVRGFNYKKATSKIIMPAQHLRIGNKDYLIFAEENGKLQIKDRRGNNRITVAGKYDIKTQPVEVEQGGFVFYTNNLEKINISTSGNLKTQKLNDPFYKTTKHGVTAFIQAQNLRINQAEIELPFGLYTNPEIYRIGNQTYVTLTDIQENKVYVYNAKGSLLQGFPVYGKASAFLADANRNGKPNLIVQTDDDTLTQYSVE